MLTKQETLLGRGAGVESTGGKGTQEDCSAIWLTVLGFMVVGLVSRLSLANHSDSVLRSGVYSAQPRWTPAKRILGGWKDIWTAVSF